MDSGYAPPLALTVLSGIFLLLGAICAVVVAADIIWRRGWRSMMWIMIPVYVICSTFTLPLTAWVYFKYGRAAKPLPTPVEQQGGPKCHKEPPKDTNRNDDSATTVKAHNCHARDGAPHHQPAAEADDSESRNTSADASVAEKASPPQTASADAPKHCCHDDSSRPMYATILVGVSHCGAGCVLGDLVGEWLVYGTNATINGHTIWVELLVDYAFALLFGIAFQYFSIAPMSGEYGLTTVWRAAKADVLSLTSFEVGAFAWMVIYQVGIFDYRLSMATWTYWWMMQIGMCLGFATAMPVNWWLIKTGIKEPCA